MDANGRQVAVVLGRLFVSTGYWTSSDGHSFAPVASPCTANQVAALGAITRTRQAALCSSDFGGDEDVKELYAATDGGPFELVGSGPSDGRTNDYLSLAPGEDVITAASWGSYLFRSTARGWTTPLHDDTGVPFFDLQFVDAQHGYVVWGSPKAGRGQLYSTTDAGSSWAQLPVT